MRPHTQGCDLEQVEQAAAAFENGDLRRVRELLQIAIVPAWSFGPRAAAGR